MNNIDREQLTQNMGELLKPVSKHQKRINKLNKEIENGKAMLKDITLDDSIEETVEKVTRLLHSFYGGANLTKQMGYLMNFTKKEQIVTQAYSVVMSKQVAREKACVQLTEELGM